MQEIGKKKKYNILNFRLLERLSKTNPEKSLLFSEYQSFNEKLAGNLSFGILFAAMVLN